MTSTPTTPSAAPSSHELPPQYRPADVEPAITQTWDAARAWHAEPSPIGSAGDSRPFSIVIPPPNVTAALHMGHALNNTLQDILTRYHRMLGDNAMWMPGTDHAGIATQTVVEKRVLQEEGKRRTDFSRDEFIAKIQAWKDQYEAHILGQLKAMGASCDWDRTRFTMDDVCAKAVREAFFRLFKDGLIYRGKYLVNWDPVTQTVLADDEVEMEEVNGQFYYLRYPVCDASGAPHVHAGLRQYVTVATTRPETMLGDTAVAVNPKDPRAASLRGKYVKLPIVNRVVPIIEDAYVTLPDPNSSDAKAKYSSGFLKVTPAHDPNDWQLGQRHNLFPGGGINVMALDASISLDHGWAAQEPHQKENNELRTLVGLAREEARKAVVRWFKEHELLEEVKPYRHSVGHSYRSHVPVEPYLSDQWYIATKKQIPSLPDEGIIEGTDVPRNSLAGLALRALSPDQRTTAAPHVHAGLQAWEGKLRFTPERYAKTYETWNANLRDWPISRQLWWGHRIPVWSYTFGSAPSASLDGAVGEGRLRVEVMEQVERWQAEGRLVHVFVNDGYEYKSLNEQRAVAPQFIAVREQSDVEVVKAIESVGFTQDPDVLDTWFSSGLWPLSTMGWPAETPELQTWNPTDVLCTAREIITLWVSRMVMFNLYFRDQLPFRDVFIHAMIQDGHGQKMSKSLGNGVDPIDTIHTHGADAMRFTLASMTTHTQDVRMPVDLIDPFTQETFTPQFITGPGGYKVAAPIQERNGKKIASSYGVSSGQVKPNPETPLARNTSEKFDFGRNFANKLWNAVRFALPNLKGPAGTAHVHAEVQTGDLALADRWILSRLARTVQSVDQSLQGYAFAEYAQTVYDFFWRDLCDWYIEAVKPTIAQSPAQQQVLAACLDVSLRLLHPAMPFITERLWSALNEAVPERGLAGMSLPPNELLMKSAWPRVTGALINEDAEKTFGLIVDLVTAIRQVRTTYKVPPKQVVEVSCKAPPAIAQVVLDQREIAEALGGFKGREIGPSAQRPKDAAVATIRDAELYVHGLIDADTERQRLQKKLGELEKQIANIRGRLSNESYIAKAPPKLVEQSRDQLAGIEREAESIRTQLGAL